MKVLLIISIVTMTNLSKCFNDTHRRFTTHDANLTLLSEIDRFLRGFNNSYQRLVLSKQLERCPYTRLCTFPIKSEPGLFFYGDCCERCDCDYPLCMQRKTCCPDIIFQNIDVSAATTNTTDELRLHTGEDTFQTCIPLYLTNNHIEETNKGAFGYANCPSETIEGMWQNCTRTYTAEIELLEDIVPVLYIANNTLYRNKYCAYCHNITDEEFKPLDTKLLCKSVTRFNSEKNIINEVVSNNVCEIAFVNDTELDSCLPAISTCNATGLSTVIDPEVESACDLYRSVVTTDKGLRRFQNVFCSECNGIYQSDIQCSQDERESVSGITNDFAFSGLLKLDDQDSLNSHKSPRDMCSENQIYDAISHICREMICPVHMDLSKGNCVDIFEKLEYMMYSTFIRITPVKTISMDESFAVSNSVFDYAITWISFLGKICNAHMIFQSGTGFDENNKQQLGNSTLLFYDIRIEFFIELYHEPNEVIEHILKHQKFSIFQLNFGIKVIDTDPKPFDIISILSDTYTSTISQETFDPFESNVSIREYAFAGYRNLISFPYLTGINDKSCIQTTAPFNILWLTSCPKVNISKVDFPWTKTIDGVLIHPGFYNLKFKNFYFTDENHIMVCVDSFKEILLNASTTNGFSFSKATVLSIVCSSLSIISLIITFMTFSIFHQLRQTIPGKNNMTLVFFLFIAQSLYLISSLGNLNTNDIGCIILGMLVHFFWLVAMFWMNICTFHMFRVLAKVKVISHGSGRKRLICYHIYAVVMAAILVLMNIIASYSLMGDTGYGGQICYITSQKMVNYTFIIPTTLVVVSNISMFLFVIIKITRISSVQKNVQHERNNLNIFAKLSTITGATWVFGLLYTWTGSIVLSYLFIILNACQGVFVMFAFVINKRVYDLLKTNLSVVTSTGSSGTASSGFTTKL